MSAPETTPPPRPKDRLQLAWICALGLIVLAAILFHFPLRPGPSAAPKWSGAWPGRGPSQVPGGWEERRKEFWRMRDDDRGAVVFVGDSITDWWEGLPKAFPELRVANRGIAGDVSRAVLYRLGEDVLDLQPRGVVILIGTNDLRAGAEPEDVAFNIGEMLAEIAKRSPGTPVVVCLVMPREREEGLFPEKIRALNALLEKTARPGVVVCDTFTPFATGEGTARADEFPDLLHPNARGYAKLAGTLRPALKAAGILK